MADRSPPKPFTLAELLAFEQRIRRRNQREWLACALVGPYFAWQALSLPSRTAAVFAIELVCAAAYVAFRIDRDGRTTFAPEERCEGAVGRAALVRELRHQSALLARAGWWYAAPLAVGMLGMQLALAGRARPLAMSATLLLLSAVVAVNRVAARRLERRADELATE